MWVLRVDTQVPLAGTTDTWPAESSSPHPHMGPPLIHWDSAWGKGVDGSYSMEILRRGFVFIP